MNKVISFQNKYGSLKIEVIGEYKNVGQISSKRPDFKPEALFSIETAEKIALITGNQGIQLSVSHDYKQMYVIHHESSNIGAICKVVELNFTSSVNPRQEIEDVRPKYVGGF